MSATPPEIGEKTFNEVDKSNCILNVPTGSSMAYWTADYWNEFLDIAEVNFPATGIEDVELNKIAFTINGNSIDFGNDNYSLKSVYDAQGRMIYNGNDSYIMLPQSGVYIINGKKYFIK